MEREDGSSFRGRNVVLATGTFLRGAIETGTDRSTSGGRAGDAPSLGLARKQLDLDLDVGRFKTGTPLPRVDGRSVDRDAPERQDGDHGGRFSHWSVGRA